MFACTSAVVPNRNSPPAILLREGWREGNKTRQPTLANLSSWPPQKIATFRRLLRDETLVSPHDLLSTARPCPTAMSKLSCWRFASSASTP
jgi:hypothetical protein